MLKHFAASLSPSRPCFEVVEGIDLGKRDMEKRIRAFAER